MSELVELVQKRAELLDEAAGAARTKPELVDATGSSRSTIDRGVSELVAADLLVQEKSTYRATDVAVRILRSFREFEAEAERYYEFREAIAGLPQDEALPAMVLDGADVEIASPNMPGRTARKGFQGIREADRVIGTCPVLLNVYEPFYQEAVIEHGIELEVVFTPDVVEVIEAEYPGSLQQKVDTGRARFYESADVPSYSLSIVDGLDSATDGSRLNLLVHTEKGLQSMILTDAPDAVAWAREKYRSLRADAEQFAP